MTNYPGKFFVVENTDAGGEICAFIATRLKIIDNKEFNEILSFRYFIPFPQNLTGIQRARKVPQKGAWQAAAKTCLLVILGFLPRSVPVNHVHASGRKRP